MQPSIVVIISKLGAIFHPAQPGRDNLSVLARSDMELIIYDLHNWANALLKGNER